MCLAVPAKVVSVEGERAGVELGGIRRTVSVLLVPEVKPGQYVLVHAGFAIQTIDAGEAAETLELLQPWMKR
jgi:hydrogenase expression/formation protein HypC